MSADTHFPAANALTARLYETLKRHPKRIVFADGEDIRVIRVAARMVAMEIAVPILIGNRERIHKMAKDAGLAMTFVNVIDPAKSSDLSLFCERLKKVARYRGKEIADPCEIVSRPHNFAAMMVQYGHADGMVAGNQSMPATVFRAAMTMIKPIKDVPKVFGAMIMVAPHLQNFGRDGVLFMADCGVIPDPNVKQLASIAVETGKLARHFLGRRPRIAMLSHSTHGSAGTESAKKVLAATELARQKIHDEYLEIDIDGEIQADAALDSTAAEIKIKDSRAQDPADVLVFPNLDAGHISLKLLQHVGGAQNYGQLIMGLSRPSAQVPRTVSEETLLGTAAIVGAEAIKFHEFYLAKER
ncbi:phosphotransacetylase [Oceaniferula spumae]|uniref:Phosphotransacetylase n=1 Tax=Oceaniferula spumae TaxID=2979115 RepID=A0AAT9FIP5_9BACT